VFEERGDNLIGSKRLSECPGRTRKKETAGYYPGGSRASGRKSAMANATCMKPCALWRAMEVKMTTTTAARNTKTARRIFAMLMVAFLLTLTFAAEPAQAAKKSKKKAGVVETAVAEARANADVMAMAKAAVAQELTVCDEELANQAVIDVTYTCSVILNYKAAYDCTTDEAIRGALTRSGYEYYQNSDIVVADEMLLIAAAIWQEGSLLPEDVVVVKEIKAKNVAKEAETIYVTGGSLIRPLYFCRVVEPRTRRGK